MGLPQHHRLKHWRQFQSVYKQGRRYSGPCLIVRCQRLVSPPTRSTQVGIAVGKRISKKAVVRNRLKRQIRAALRPLLPGLSENYQIVIGAKSTALECGYEHFLRELKQLLTKAEVWNGH